MDLIEFRRSLRRHLRASLAAAIVVLLVVGLTTSRGGNVKYKATSTVLVTPRAERFKGASASVLRVILPNVIVVVRSDSLRKAAAGDVPAPFLDDPIVVDAAFDNQASALFISVQSKSAASAVAWSGALARALTQRMSSDPYLAVQVLDVANGATLSGKRVRLLGIVASAGLALAAFVLVAFAAERLEESRDIAAALRRRGVRVLGSVAATRRYRRKTDALTVIQAALIRDDQEGGQLVVTTLGDPALAAWLAAGLRSSEPPIGGVDDPSVGAYPSGYPGGHLGLRDLDVVAGPSVDQMAMSTHAAGPCVLAVDGGGPSIAEILAGLHALEQAGITCRGVILVRGVRHIAASNRHDEPLAS
jgi:hypothetical protein